MSWQSPDTFFFKQIFYPIAQRKSKGSTDYRTILKNVCGYILYIGAPYIYGMFIIYVCFTIVYCKNITKKAITISQRQRQHTWRDLNN